MNNPFPNRTFISVALKVMPATIPSSAMPAQISTSVPKLVVLAELAPSANAVAQHSAEMTAAKQPMNEKEIAFPHVCFSPCTPNPHVQLHSSSGERQ